MKQLLQNYKLNKKKKVNEFYEACKEISDRLHQPQFKIMSLLKGISPLDIHKIYLSAVSLSKDSGIPFSRSFYWILKEIKK